MCSDLLLKSLENVFALVIIFVISSITSNTFSLLTFFNLRQTPGCVIFLTHNNGSDVDNPCVY